MDGDDGPHGPRTREAIALCLTCAELCRCREWLASIPASRKPRGVVGGRFRGHLWNPTYDGIKQFRRNRNHYRKDREVQYSNRNDAVPLNLVAAEVGLSADELAQRLGDAVAFDAVTGLRSISAERCREYLASHRAAQQAEKECLQRQQAEFQARMAELDRRNRAQRIGGRPAVSGNALADLMADDQR